jgi:hypothetical protein
MGIGRQRPVGSEYSAQGQLSLSLFFSLSLSARFRAGGGETLVDGQQERDRSCFLLLTVKRGVWHVRKSKPSKSGRDKLLPKVS